MNVAATTMQILLDQSVGQALNGCCVHWCIHSPCLLTHTALLQLLPLMLLTLLPDAVVSKRRVSGGGGGSGSGGGGDGVAMISPSNL